jgi:PleD family two-component response regulator
MVASYRKLAMAIRRRRQSKGRPTLSDVLTGEVTKQVMKADQVTFLSGTLITVRMSDAPGRILLIEDDPDVGPLLERALLQAGFKVHWVSTVSEAQALLDERNTTSS